MKTKMNENTKVTLTIGQIRKLVESELPAEVSRLGEEEEAEFPDMPPDVAEDNNVVAAECCRWCRNYKGEFDASSGPCDKLKYMTYPTDVCDHFGTRSTRIRG